MGLVRVAGAVLCGGASRRMGRDKATMVVDGTAMAVRVARSLDAGGCRPVFAIGGDADALNALGIADTVADEWPGEGPVGGIATALGRARSTASADAVLVAACDMPWLAPSTVAAMIAVMDDVSTGVVVATTDARQPLLSVWHRDTEDLVRGRFAAGERRVRALYDHVQVTEVVIDASSALNVNRPEDVLDRPSQFPGR